MVPYMGTVSASRNGGGATWRRQVLGSLFRWPAPSARTGITLPIRIRRTTRVVSSCGSSARPVGTTPSIARRAEPGHRADAMRARLSQGRSSTGRATVSKTVGCGFESCRPCHLNRRTGDRYGGSALPGGRRPQESAPARFTTAPRPCYNLYTGRAARFSLCLGIFASKVVVTWNASKPSLRGSART